MTGRGTTKDPLLSAALLKMSMVRKGLGDTPGFRVVYKGALSDLGVTDDEVNAYIATHRAALDTELDRHGSG